MMPAELPGATRQALLLHGADGETEALWAATHLSTPEPGFERRLTWLQSAGSCRLGEGAG